MSFKREGNDKEQLNVLRQRRVRDLVGENIPEDEAKLLSNGKFTCLVCSYHPIFDTIDLLLVHRTGKKHEKGADIFFEKQRELKNLIEKRKAEHYEKHGNTNIKIAKEHLNNRHLQTSVPYDARSKKLKPYDRKPKLHIGPLSASIQSPSASRLSDLPGSSRSKWGHIHPTSEPIMHDAKLKNIFRPPVADSTIVKPYISQRKNTPQFENDSSQNKLVLSSSATISCTSNRIMPNVSTEPTRKEPPSIAESPKSPNVDVPKVITDEQRAVSNKIQQLRGAGWKRDWDGKWIKDEDAEFDSDEEPPDILYEAISK